MHLRPLQWIEDRDLWRDLLVLLEVFHWTVLAEGAPISQRVVEVFSLHDLCLAAVALQGHTFDKFFKVQGALPPSVLMQLLLLEHLLVSSKEVEKVCVVILELEFINSIIIFFDQSLLEIQVDPIQDFALKLGLYLHFMEALFEEELPDGTHQDVVLAPHHDELLVSFELFHLDLEFLELLLHLLMLVLPFPLEPLSVHLRLPLPQSVLLLHLFDLFLPLGFFDLLLDLLLLEFLHIDLLDLLQSLLIGLIDLVEPRLLLLVPFSRDLVKDRSELGRLTLLVLIDLLPLLGHLLHLLGLDLPILVKHLYLHEILLHFHLSFALFVLEEVVELLLPLLLIDSVLLQLHPFLFLHHLLVLL
mmetsp:Transcript_18026/g.17210  ORF Transcript_18026/g.17210 Transcript_18026/m.17210 type:complete len:359 (+) Transcript_18026:280-1356(+)